MKYFYNILLLLLIFFLIIINVNHLNEKNIAQSKTTDIIPKAFTVQNPYLKIDKTKIKNNKIPSIISDNTIYLTFDDGPSYLTKQILDILKKENVSATFFVIGTHIYDYKDSVIRAYQDGHTVAIHSDTHNYSYIYSDDQNYFNDFQAISEKIYDIIGHHTHIVRLPGGSSNTVSKKYNPGIVTRITENLKANDYYYFDWNIDSGDASGDLPKEQIYENVTKALHYGTNIVLMHDSASKKTTVDALNDIIKFGKENGYTFAKITKNTLPIRHNVNN